MGDNTLEWVMLCVEIGDIILLVVLIAMITKLWHELMVPPSPAEGAE